MAAALFNIAKIFAMKLKNLILCILNLFKRALCIFKRRTPTSPVLPVVVTDLRSATYDIPEDDVASWDAWDSNNFQSSVNPLPSIETPRNQFLPEVPQEPQQHQQQQQLSVEDDVVIDYFAGMAPETFKAPKIVVKKKSPHSVASTATAAAATASSTLYSDRLAVADNASDGLALAPPQELEALDDWDNPLGEENAWVDEENEELDWEVEYALRETRRQELERKKWEQQQRRMMREMQKTRTNSTSNSSNAHFQTIQSLSH